MEDQRFAKSAETIQQRLASLRSSSIAELKEQWRVEGTLWLPAAASHQPRTADSCSSIPHPRASLRRAQTLHSTASDSPR